MIESALFYGLSVIAYAYSSKNSKKRRVTGMLIIMASFMLSFAFQPLYSDDLAREYAALDGIRQYGWEYFSRNAAFYDSGLAGTVVSSKFEGLYITQLMYYFFAHLPVYNFMPATVVAIQFYLEFKLLEKIDKRFNLTNIEHVVLFLLFFLTRELRWMMSGIRNQLAFTIALYAVFEDLVEHKSKILCLIKIGLSCMIHQSAIVFLAVRLVLFIPSKKLKFLISGIMLFWSNWLELLMHFLKKFSNIAFINSLLWKVTIYTQNDSGSNNNIILRPYYVKMMIADMGLILFSLVTCYLFYKLYKKGYFLNSRCPNRVSIQKGVIRIARGTVDKTIGYLNPDYFYFILFITCITIGSNMYYWIYLRFAMILEIGLFVLCGAVFYGLRESNQIRKKNRYMIMCLLAILLKITIMMLVANTSFNFDLVGFYPR